MRNAHSVMGDHHSDKHMHHVSSRKRKEKWPKSPCKEVASKILLILIEKGGKDTQIKPRKSRDFFKEYEPKESTLAFRIIKQPRSETKDR